MPQFAHNTDLIPNSEVDLTVLTFSVAATITFATVGANGTVQALPTAASPLILLVKADHDFYEGENAPDAAINGVREGGIWHAIPVNGRAAWKFLPVSGTVVLKGKLLLGS